MTFEEANEKIKYCDSGAMRTFGCLYFHNICIKCKRRPECNRKEPLIKECNFYEAEEKQI